MTDKIVWTDATRYSKGKRGQIEPTSWECKVNGVRVWLSNAHIYHSGAWVVTMPGTTHLVRELAGCSVPAQEAQQLALDYVTDYASGEVDKWQKVADAIAADARADSQ